MGKRPDINEMATAPLGKLFFRMAVPLVISQLIMIANNMLDRMYVGHIEGCGGDSLTAVGLAVGIMLIPTAVASLISGGSPLLSIYLGKQEMEKAHRLVGSSLSFLLVVPTVFTLFVVIFAEPILVLSGSSPTIMPYAKEYLLIDALSIVPLTLCLGLMNYIGAQGLTKLVMLYMGAAVAINMVLDPLFIFGFGWGVGGAAWATVVSAVVPAIMVIKELCNPNNVICLQPKYLKPDWHLLSSCIALGFSPFLAILCESATTIVYNSSMLRFGNDDTVGTMTVYFFILQLYMFIALGISMGMQPIIGYCFGQRNFTRVKQCARMLIVVSLISGIIAWLVLMLFPSQVSSIFTEDRSLAQFMASKMHLFFALVCFSGVTYACTNLLRFLERKTESILIVLIRRVALTIPLVLILPELGCMDPVDAILVTGPIIDGACVIISMLFIYNVLKRLA